MNIGNVRATAVVELAALSFPADKFFDRPTSEQFESARDWLVPHSYDPESRSLFLSHHAWLLSLPGATVLIDPCVGNDKPRPVLPFYDMLSTPWLERLASAGAFPHEIDLVICTHLHSDHCGWNTTLVNGAWVPTFPNARYVFSRADEEYWKAGQDDPQLAYNAGVYADSVLPIIEAGQAMIVDGTLEVTRGLTLEPAPGHTPGHSKVTLESGGDGVVFAGDSMHHALQVAYPELNTGGCFDVAAAESTRRSILATCADRGFLLAPAHFPAPHLFRVERAGDGFRLPDMHTADGIGSEPAGEF